MAQQIYLEKEHDLVACLGERFNWLKAEIKQLFMENKDLIWMLIMQVFKNIYILSIA